GVINPAPGVLDVPDIVTQVSKANEIVKELEGHARERVPEQDPEHNNLSALCWWHAEGTFCSAGIGAGAGVQTPDDSRGIAGYDGEWRHILIDHRPGADD